MASLLDCAIFLSVGRRRHGPDYIVEVGFVACLCAFAALLLRGAAQRARMHVLQTFLLALRKWALANAHRSLARDGKVSLCRAEFWVANVQSLRLTVLRQFHFREGAHEVVGR